jgi:uncharacterized tellurite resistance protein B-like protein
MKKQLSNADQVRSVQDLELFEQLLEDSTVQEVNKVLARKEEQGPLGTRRRLLATAVRLSRGMALNLHKMADNCRERLGLDIPLELYVYASPQLNAACVKPEDGRLFILFSSSIIEGFSDNELQFVIGHELGHYNYGHHDIPIGHILRGHSKPVSPRLALDLSSWSRYAEVSADRAGAYCSDTLETVAHALFKLASGITGSQVSFNLKEFLSQLDEMQLAADDPGQSAPTEDWFSTHPFSPLRVRALQLFYESEWMDAKGFKAADLELGIQGLMSLMEPSYLEGRTDTAEAMRRLLFSSAIAIMDANDGVNDDEKALFEKFFGAHSLDEKLNIEKTIRILDDRIEQANESASLAQRMQVVRDLCSISRADGHVHPKECALLRDIAKKLGIGEFFVNRTLEELTELD